MKQIIFLLIFAACSEISYAYRTIVRVDKLELCNGSADNLLNFYYIRISNPEGQNSVISMKFKVQEDVQTVKLSATVTKCKIKESLDTCELFTVLNPINSCGMLSLDNMAWTNFVKNSKPPIKCPFKKGVYVVTNGTFDATLFSFFPFHDNYWRVKLTIYGEHNDFAMLCGDLRDLRVNV